ncbi:hypothetical protein [Prescottella equi]|nr:hypothetical protein [Prescottella equi]
MVNVPSVILTWCGMTGAIVPDREYAGRSTIDVIVAVPSRRPPAMSVMSA